MKAQYTAAYIDANSSPVFSFIPYWKKPREPSSPVLFPSTSRPNHPRNTCAFIGIPRDDYIAQNLFSLFKS